MSTGEHRGLAKQDVQLLQRLAAMLDASLRETGVARDEPLLEAVAIALRLSDDAVERQSATRNPASFVVAAAAWRLLLESGAMDALTPMQRAGSCQAAAFTLFADFALRGDQDALWLALTSDPAYATGRLLDAYADARVGEAAHQLAQAGCFLRRHAEQTADSATASEAIRLLERAVELAPDDPAERATIVCDAGNAYMTRHRAGGPGGDLSTAVERLEDAARITPADARGRPVTLMSLANALRLEHGATGDPSRLDRAIAVSEEAFAGAGGTNYLAPVAHGLAAGLLQRGSEGDVRRALEVLRPGLEGSPADSPYRELLESLRLAALDATLDSDPGFAAQLLLDESRTAPTGAIADDLAEAGVRLRRRAEHTGDLRLSQDAVRLLDRALEIAPGDVAVRADSGTAYLTCSELGGPPSDLATAVHRLQAAIEASAADAATRGGAGVSLAAALRRQYDRHGDATLLDRSIETAARAFEDTRATPVHAAAAQATAAGLLLRFEASEDAADLARAAELARDALHALDIDSAYRAALEAIGDAVAELVDQRLARVTAGLESWYTQGDRRSLESAEHDLRCAMAGSPPDSREHLLARTTLGVTLMDRPGATRAEQAEGFGMLRDCAAAADAQPELRRPIVFLNLGEALRGRYENEAAHTLDLDDAITYLERGLAAATDDTEMAGLLRSALGNALRLRAERGWTAADLAAAIDHLQGATAVLPAGADRTKARSRLAACHSARYAHDGRLADLEEAVSGYRQALAESAREAPNHAVFASGLANALQSRGERMGADDDIDEAIALYRDAIAADPTAPNADNRRANLASALLVRHERVDDPQALAEAVRGLEDAVEATPSGHPHRPARLSRLALAYLRRYEAGGDLAELHRAVVRYREAVPVGGDSPEFDLGLASALSLLHRATDDPAIRDEAVGLFQRVCERTIGTSANIALAAARNWGYWASRRQAFEEAADAFGYAITAVGQLFELQALRGEKEAWLRVSSNLPSAAAYALSRAGRDADAVLALERGRALVLSDTLEREHADLDLLAARGSPDLAAGYRSAAQRVLTLEHRASPNVGDGPDIIALRELIAARKQLDELVARIREVAGYEGFLTAPTLDEIQDVARQMPLVYVLATEHGGVMLHVDGATIASAPLPALTEAALTEHLLGYLRAVGQPSWAEELDRMGAWLWTALVGPVLDTVPRRPLALVPVGLLGLVPLHAAWREDASRPTGRWYAVDAAPISLTPSARVLGHCLDGVKRADARRAVCASDPSTLRYADNEVAEVSRHFSDVRLLRAPDRMPDDPLGALVGGGVMHFACHARAHLLRPLESTIALSAEHQITVADLLTHRLRGSRLAILSACETAVMGAELPDEVVGFPSAFVEAGAAGVIGSLWRVPDASTLALMTRFYELWRERDLEPPEALRQAQIAIRDATNGQLRADFPQIAELRGDDVPEWLRPEWEQGRDLSSPHHWASFVYTGV